MDTGLKQRLIGAAVLIALAVIFLPMLVKGPAPDSDAGEVSMKMSDPPEGATETRDLPLVTPGDVPKGGAVGLGATPVDRPAAQPVTASPVEGAPAVDPTTGQPATGQPVAGQPATATPAATTVPAASAPALPATTAGGNFVVHFGAYASQKGADTVAAAVKAAQLPAYTEATTVGGKPAFRVRIGPYATRAEAESVRLKALEVRSDVPVRVVALDAEPAPAPAAATSSAAAVAEPAKPAAKPAEVKPPVAASAKPNEAKPNETRAIAAKPAEQKPVPVKPTEQKPQPVAAAPKPAAPKPTPAAPAAAKIGFAVQVGAFGDATEAGAMRERLRAAGFSAFTDTVTTDAGKLTRVRVGPVIDRAAADQLKAQIQAKTGVDGIVRPHP